MFGTNKDVSLADSVNRRSWYREKNAGQEEANAFRRY